MAGSLFIVFILVLSLTGCTGDVRPPQPAPAADAATYWHQGQAELSRFNLKQVRYGQTYRGDAVMIFVKEDFLPLRQVKHEGRSTDETPVPVLKLIATRDFLTGMYPYSLMTSVFSPLAPGKRGSYKVTATTQDWCGQTFMQVNSRDTGLAVTYRSYFEGEGDRDFIVRSALLEDELFTLARSGPDHLPVGEVSVLPSLHCVQLRIKEFHEHPGSATLESAFLPELIQDSVWVYRIRYRDIRRTFSITFGKSFPHAILAWEENEGGLEGGEVPLTTRGVRTHIMMSDYWNRSAPADTVLRRGLGL